MSNLYWLSEDQTVQSLLFPNEPWWIVPLGVDSVPAVGVICSPAGC